MPSPNTQFDQFIQDKKYLKALHFVLTLDKDKGNKSPFRIKFRQNNIFLMAIREAVESSDTDIFLFKEQFQFPDWFLDLMDEPSPDWYKEYRLRFLTAHLDMARLARSALSLETQGIKDLTHKIGFSSGFVLDLFYLLKNGNVIQPGVKKRIPILIAREGTQGTAAYLIIEQVKFDYPLVSEPYPHPAEMFNISFDPNFEETMSNAFEYVREELLRTGYQKTEIPIFRWRIELTQKEIKEKNNIYALEGRSLHGAFLVGMSCLAKNCWSSENIAITCNVDKYGQLLGINELAQKCQAAERENWKVIIAKKQDTEQGNNALKKATFLLRTDHIKKAIEYFTSEKGFETINYLNLIDERLGNLPINELPDNYSSAATFDEITAPMKVHFLKGKETEITYHWDNEFKNIRRAVLYGWKGVGKTRLLKYEARRIAQENMNKLKVGELNLEQVTFPIFLQCPHLANQLKSNSTFEKAIFATLKTEYRINGQTLSDDFVHLIQTSFTHGQCVLLLDDFSLVHEKLKSTLTNKLNQFARNYPKSRILITIQQKAKNNKNDYGELPLEITTQPDEFILELLSQHSDIPPYKGLQFFDFNNEDPKYFYGRDELSRQLLSSIENKNFLAVLGNSGSGKSSIVRAGVLHQLKLGEQRPGSEQWKICQPITPTLQNRNPFRNLKLAFTEAQLPVANNVIEIKQAEELIATIDEIRATRVILTIDQFEEIFTNCDEEERQQFFACLLGALAQTGDKLCLIVAIRADFHGKWAEYSELSYLIDDNSTTIRHMTPDKLKQTIIEPAKKVGLGIEQYLVKQILEDMKDSPGELPLLQFVLEQLWLNKKTNWLTLAEYNRIGGIKGALQKYADGIYDALTSAKEKETAQWIFQNLAQLGDGVEDTRKQISQQDLITSEYTQELVDATVQKLVKARLIVIN